MLAAPLGANSVSAQSDSQYPIKAIRMIVPSAPGSGPDIKSLRTCEMQERLAAEGTEPVGNTPEQFAQTVRNDIAKWAKVVKSSGARPE